MATGTLLRLEEFARLPDEPPRQSVTGEPVLPGFPPSFPGVFA